MGNVTLRSAKGSPLTSNEMDANFNFLDTNKAPLTLSITAAITLGGNRVVIMTPTGCQYADKDTPSHIGKVVGVTTQAVTSGNVANVMPSGTLNGFSGLVAGTTYYLGNNGNIVTAVSTGISQQIGVAYSSDALIISLSQPILIE